MKVLAAAARAMEEGRRVALCTVIAVNGSTPRSSGARMLVDDVGELVGTIGGGHWEHVVTGEALKAIADGKPRRVKAHLTRDLGMCCGGEMEVYVEALTPQQQLHIFGAGHVAQELARMARALEFRVLVYDDREEWLTEQRFPGCVLIEGDPLRHLPTTGPGHFVVIVTHNHQLDQDLVERLLPGTYDYLGMIGSRTKVTRFMVRFKAAGVEDHLLRRLSAPIGLDLGAETPAEIAVSIAAELVRVRRDHQGPTSAMSAQTIPARGGDVVPPRWNRD